MDWQMLGAFATAALAVLAVAGVAISYGAHRQRTANVTEKLQRMDVASAYFFFCRGARNSRVCGAGSGFSAFGLRISRLLLF